MPKIRDITDPTEFIPEPTTPWWIWALVAIGVLLLIILAMVIIAKSKTRRAQRSCLDEARALLADLKKQATRLPPEEIATKTSGIIRQYLETAFDDPAIFETNEEFKLRTTALETLHPEIKTQITRHLEQLSELKYEPHPDSTAASTRADTLIDEADELLAQIEFHPGPMNH